MRGKTEFNFCSGVMINGGKGLQCLYHTRIPVLDYQDLSVTIFTDVMSFVASTVVKEKSLAYRPD